MIRDIRTTHVHKLSDPGTVFRCCSPPRGTLSTLDMIAAALQANIGLIFLVFRHGLAIGPVYDKHIDPSHNEGFHFVISECLPGEVSHGTTQKCTIVALQHEFALLVVGNQFVGLSLEEGVACHYSKKGRKPAQWETHHAGSKKRLSVTRSRFLRCLHGGGCVNVYK